MQTLTQFSRKINVEIRNLYILAKLLPLPATCIAPRAGVKKFYADDAIQEWYEKALEIKNRPVPVEFNPMKDAPVDRPIILDVGYPWAVVGQWNEADQSWCYANLQAQKMNTGDTDVWFENEQEKNPKGWLPMPEVNHVNKR